MKKLVFTILALFSIQAYADADWLSPDGMTKVMEGVDDGTFHVPLGHSFPYYGGVFTDAWMSTNGVILLYDPVNQFGNSNTRNSMCCSGQDLSNNNYGGQFSFMLAPLWTDLVDRNLTPDDGYYYKTNEGVSSFLWYNVNEYYNDNKNTFQVNLWPDGSFDFLYDEVDITQHNTFIGFTGNIDYGEVTQLGYYQGSVTEFDIDFHNQTVNGGRAWYGNDGGYEASLDCSDALNDPNCPGYEEAYFEFQCSSDPLYDMSCAGYDNAILVQNLSGQDFVFGDNIEDFYETTEPAVFFEEPVIYEEVDYGYDDTEMFEQDNGMYEEEYNTMPEEQMETSFDDFTEETFTEPTVEEFADPVVEELADPVVEESFEEEITHEQEVMSNPEPELLIEEELAQESVDATENLAQESAAERVGSPVNALEIAREQIANANSLIERNNVSREAQQAAASEESFEEANATDEFLSGQIETDMFTFGSMDQAFEEATIEAVTDPSVVIVTVQDQTQEEEQSVEFQMETSTAQSSAGFAAQQDQSFSTGQSITAVLNNVAPNFSKFDVAPPSQQEQQTTQKAESQANNMSEEQLAENLEDFSNEMKDSGGFTDQSLTVLLMGRNSAFSQYSNVQLQDNPFYDDKGMPGGSIQNDRRGMLRLVGTDNKHDALVSLQYK